MTANKSERLAVLSDAEQEALYGLPDFDDAQQLDFLSLSEAELALASSRPRIHAQVYCIILQIGYFKAKQAFFRFEWDDVEDDCAFVLSRYFNGEAFDRKTITKHEHYAQRGLIAGLFVYRLWSGEFLPELARQAAQIARRDVTPGFVAAEVLDNAAKALLAQLIARDDTLSELAALRQDAKNFRWRQMAREREKRAKLEPLYGIAKILLPKLDISHQNRLYYASLNGHYTFQADGRMIDLDAIVAALDLG